MKTKMKIKMIKKLMKLKIMTQKIVRMMTIMKRKRMIRMTLK